MPRTPIELPPVVARNLRAYHAEKSAINADGIAARQLHALKQHYNGRLKLHGIDHDGTVLRSIEAARAEATRTLLDIARDNASRVQSLRPMTIGARDDQGPIFEVSITVRVLDHPNT